MVVQRDLKLSTAADIVADPSAPDAFVKGILEGVEYWYDSATDSWKEEKLDSMKKNMHKLSKRELEERALSLFEEYLSFMVKK
jgi:hypothetical protein